ncbi:MAG TPA: hypothetical protein VJ998_00790, partial [Pseudomonadales bacterium]|nr:hypothetical protein [Pseudomonadales bacterium]
MNLHRLTFLVAALVSICAFAVSELSHRLPAVVPASAPAGQFSADRAFALESQILKDRAPHPNGSAANHRVRQRIENFLTANQIPYDIQRSWGCSTRFNRCAWVENIIARVD